MCEVLISVISNMGEREVKGMAITRGFQSAKWSTNEQEQHGEATER